MASSGGLVAPEGFKMITEGSASILYEADESQGDRGEPVFYNKVQVLNRDLSIRMITLFARQRARELANPKGNRAKRRAAFKAKQEQEKQVETTENAGIDPAAPAGVAASEASEASAAAEPASSSQGGTEGGTEGRDVGLEGMGPEELDAKLRSEAQTSGITILDALAATGLRSIRYYKEIPGVKHVVVNDLDPAAVKAAEKNVTFNGLSLQQVTPQQGDGCMAMLQAAAGGGRRFDVIDLDPYGSAAPFLDAAVQSVSDGGLLCVTCTDMAVLSGNQPEACFAKYGSMPTRGKYLHEMALRILLHSLETSACRYRRHIVPVISCGIDFYVRVFVRVFESAAEVKRTCLKRGYVHQSVRCPSFHLQPVARLNGHSYAGATGPVGGGACAETGGSFRIGGPMWTAPIHDQAWVGEALRDLEAHRSKLGIEPASGKGASSGPKVPKKAALRAAAAQGSGVFPPISTHERLHGLLTTVSEELEDVPLFYTLPSLCETLHCTSPKLDDIKSALINAGYRVSGFHKEPNALKTDAPSEVVWDVMRCWVQKRPLNKKRTEAEKSPGTMILEKPPTVKANFSRPKGGVLTKAKACRFPMNPEDFWGPKARARTVKRPPGTQEGGPQEAKGGDQAKAAKQPRVGE
eukprot:CAMPEP_0172598562 /NCGR_PEP_ID=MMETSP1068-20121228/18596_1 /TAXON_ID=35684 /ORGANISM="Pseudopedinella elastica, Strain CCMP716" /LENGTH=636 /DNA_ID=CAMNT_0013398471 /DNA_START=37 /DNA_END=1947 /DNA_ORIENTATION=+